MHDPQLRTERGSCEGVDRYRSRSFHNRIPPGPHLAPAPCLLPPTPYTLTRTPIPSLLAPNAKNKQDGVGIELAQQATPNMLAGFGSLLLPSVMRFVQEDRVFDDCACLSGMYVPSSTITLAAIPLHLRYLPALPA